MFEKFLTKVVIDLFIYLMVNIMVESSGLGVREISYFHLWTSKQTPTKNSSINFLDGSKLWCSYTSFFFFFTLRLAASKVF